MAASVLSSFMSCIAQDSPETKGPGHTEACVCPRAQHRAETCDECGYEPSYPEDLYCKNLDLPTFTKHIKLYNLAQVQEHGMTGFYMLIKSMIHELCFSSQTFSPYLPLHPHTARKSLLYFIHILVPSISSYTCGLVSFLLMFNCGKIHKTYHLNHSKCAVQLNILFSEYGRYVHSDTSLNGEKVMI